MTASDLLVRLEGARVGCPHCPKTFVDQNAVYMHAKAKHGRKLARALRPVRDDEPSMADLVIEGIQNRLMGEPNPDWLEAMFGEVIDDNAAVIRATNQSLNTGA